jgi:diguanylate cyclase (GGDEF)-like protein
MVLRLLGILALVAPAAAGLLLVTEPELTAFWVEPGSRSVVAAITAVTLGVAMTSVLAWLVGRLRFGNFVKAAEQIAAGDYTVRVSTGGGGLQTRLGVAINGISASLADTHDRATVDRLTGVANRQALLASLFAEVERATRYERPLCVAFVDIDHFKTVNDSYGHAAGDIVLRGVAQTIAENLRTSDLIGRYGGEEFMLILTETGVEEGAELSEKLRTLVERGRFKVEGNTDLSVTISIGIVGGSGQQLRMENLVRDADAAMYSAKSLGRNQTYIFEEPDENARVPRAPISEAGRSHAVELGRLARDAATDVLTSFIAPLPHYRGQPSALIASIVVAMARRLELPDAEVDRIRVAALLHDVGKVAVPQEILDKPAPLTSAEWRTVVQHPRIGQVILEHAAALKDAVPIILHHHERFAGHGYPYGLRANEIPLGARIVAIADAYDAMTHDRPYKRAISHVAAIAELRQHAGTQFDPELVTLFCDLYANHAPTPDATTLAITNSATADRRKRRTIVEAVRGSDPEVPEDDVAAAASANGGSNGSAPVPAPAKDAAGSPDRRGSAAG